MVSNLVMIDGCDGVGKTTLAAALAERGHNVIGEFSASPLGTLLKGLVNVQSGMTLSSRIAHSLALFADYVQKFHEIDHRVSRTAFVDRGHLTKTTYQQMDLETEIGTEAAFLLCDSIMRLVPQPSATVLLVCAESVLMDRLATRPGGLSTEWCQFVTEAQRRMRSRLPSLSTPTLQLDTSVLSRDEVVRQTTSFVRGIEPAGCRG